MSLSLEMTISISCIISRYSFFAPHLGAEYGEYSDAFEPMPPWNMIVESYVHRDVTFESDTPPAISGLAREIQSLTGNSYAAGLWI
jgi:hypothetical protein